jgi:hypothetical protein
MKSPNKTLMIAILLVTVVGIIGWFIVSGQRTTQSVETFEECVAAGNPVMKSYPEQCFANGKLYINEKQTLEEATTIEGIIERIESDCEPILALDDFGNVIQLEEPVICDGGSFIVVDDVRIMTEGGYPQSGNDEDVFRFDIASAKPGDKVTVTFLRQTEFSGTLDCEQCSLTVN